MSKRSKHSFAVKKNKAIVISLLSLLIVLVVLTMFLSNKPYSINQQQSTSSTPQNTLILFDAPPTINASQINFKAIATEIIPNNSVVLDAHWGHWVKMLISTNALNESILKLALNASGEQLTPYEINILNGTSNANIILNQSNNEFVLIVMWSLGINNNNSVINNGKLTHYGGSPYNLASTGGYSPLGTLQLGKLNLISMNPAEQSMVWAITNEVYRPCCDNPTSFPDCNHGAASLGLIELMASQGANKAAILNSLEAFNEFNFPGQYYDDAIFFAAHGVKFSNVAPETLLDYNFSSFTGYSNVQKYLNKYNLLPLSKGNISGCGV